MLIPILGATALAVDVGYWYFKQRDMQSAADTAAIAAAQTPDEDPAYDGTNDDFINVARGTAAEYGYVDGDGSVTVDATRVPCPADASMTCTQVEIGYTSPLFFSPVVGFSGNQNGGSGQGVAALAIAGDQNGGAASHEFCILALEDSPGVNGILANGVPKADVHGCDIFSNSDMTCNGHNLNAGDAIAVGISTGCGEVQISNADPVEDPYTEFDDNIPADTCTSYPQATGNNNTVAASNRISGTPIWPSSVVKLCGDVVLTGNVNISGKTVVIYNGRLIANGNTFTATNSTVVFAGNNNATYRHYPTDTGGNSNKNGSTFTISAPTSGDWQGVAIYTDPDLTQNVNIVQSGNEPAFNISGLFYAPNSNMTLSGIVNKAGTGYKCFVLVVNTLRLNGTGQIFANAVSECDDQGLDVPTDATGTGGRPWLVH
jgi:hypothetical protein